MRAVAVVDGFSLGSVHRRRAERCSAFRRPANLPAFAQSVGVREVDAFVETVQSLRATNRLPPRYGDERRGERPMAGAAAGCAPYGPGT